LDRGKYLKEAQDFSDSAGKVSQAIAEGLKAFADIDAANELRRQKIVSEMGLPASTPYSAFLEVDYTKFLRDNFIREIERDARN
jgi:hypothetical protein